MSQKIAKTWFVQTITAITVGTLIKIKEKYEIIRKEIIVAFPSEANKEFPHDESLFTRERISSKIKQIRVK